MVVGSFKWFRYISMWVMIIQLISHFDDPSNIFIPTVSAESATITFSNPDWSTIGPIQLLPSSSQRLSFRWTASVDRNKTMAFSKEVSNLVHDTTSNRRMDDRSWRESIIQKFESYPQWMCQGSVSLGLLQAVPHRPSRTIGGCAYEIRTRWGGIRLLTFDRPYRRWNSLLDQWKGSSKDRITLPILGGRMTATGTSQENQGSLVFTLYDDQQQQQCRRFIVTEIDQYRPMLLGAGGRWRTRVYLHTQSVIHAYVMWRFHHYIQQ